MWSTRASSFEGEGSIRCVTPPALRIGAVAVRLVHGDAVLDVSVSFEYYEEMAVHSIEPAVGVVSGGTLIRVKGDGFGTRMQLMVRIGTRALVRARVLGPTMLECMTPPQELAGPLAVEVSRNAEDFTGDEVLFEYQAALRLDELAPSRGPRSGGTAVVIAGGGFSRRSAMLAYTHARFNTTVVPAVWHSVSELRVCVICTAKQGRMRPASSSSMRSTP